HTSSVLSIPYKVYRIKCNFSDCPQGFSFNTLYVIRNTLYDMVMLFAKAKTDFLEYLEIEQNRSQKTIANYDHYLTRLSDFAGDDIQVSDITPELVRKWRLWLNRLGTNVRSEERRVGKECRSGWGR